MIEVIEYIEATNVCGGCSPFRGVDCPGCREGVQDGGRACIMIFTREYGVQIGGPSLVAERTVGAGHVIRVTSQDSRDTMNGQREGDVVQRRNGL